MEHGVKQQLIPPFRFQFRSSGTFHNRDEHIILKHFWRWNFIPMASSMRLYSFQWMSWVPWHIRQEVFGPCWRSPSANIPGPKKNLLEECHYDIMSWVFSNPGLAGHQFPAEVWCSTRTGPWSAASRPLPYPWCHRARGRVMCLHQRRTGIQLYQGLEGHHTYVFSDGLCCTSSLMSLVVWWSKRFSVSWYVGNPWIKKGPRLWPKAAIAAPAPRVLPGATEKVGWHAAGDLRGELLGEGFQGWQSRASLQEPSAVEGLWGDKTWAAKKCGSEHAGFLQNFQND